MPHGDGNFAVDVEDGIIYIHFPLELQDDRGEASLHSQVTSFAFMPG